MRLYHLGLPVGEQHHVPGMEARSVLHQVLLAVVGVHFLQDLGLGLAGGADYHPHVVAPGAGVLRGDLQHLVLLGGHIAHRALGVGRSYTGDEGPGAPVDEEVFHRVGQVAVLAEAVLREVAAELPPEIGEAGDQLRHALGRAPLRKADEARGAGAHALHGLATRFKFFDVHAWR